MAPWGVYSSQDSGLNAPFPKEVRFNKLVRLGTIPCSASAEPMGIRTVVEKPRSNCTNGSYVALLLAFRQFVNYE